MVERGEGEEDRDGTDSGDLGGMGAAAAAWGPERPSKVMAKAAAKARRDAARMQLSTMLAIRRMLMGAACGGRMGLKTGSVDSSGAEAGRAPRRMEDHSGSTDSTTGAVEIWVASTSKMRS